MSEDQSLDFKIGQLTGQITALIESNRALADSFSRLEMRFENAIKGVETRLNHDIEVINRKTGELARDTTDLKIKVSVWGGVSGFLTSVLFLFFEHFFFNK